MADADPARAEQTDKSFTLTKARALTFKGITALLLKDLSSESSRRVYRFTFQQWEQFAAQHNLDFMDLSCENIRSFLFSRSLSHSTRINRKSHMQRLLQIASYLDPAFGTHYHQLRDFTIESTSRDNAPRRQPRVLSRDECQQLLAVWKDEETHKGVRNYAVICLLLYTAIRNVELVALRWEDLDWATRTLTVCRGNKGQHCIVLIRDTANETFNALRRLQGIQSSVFVDHDIIFKHIFPALSTGRDAHFKPNKNVPVSTQTIRDIVKQTAAKAGLGKLSSLDLRHTSLRMFSEAGVSHADIPSSADGQFAAGSENTEERRVSG